MKQSLAATCFLQLSERGLAYNMEGENQSEMENAPIESGESGESCENVSDESAANKVGRPKHHFDPDDPFNPMFGLESEHFCEEALAWL